MVVGKVVSSPFKKSTLIWLQPEKPFIKEKIEYSDVNQHAMFRKLIFRACFVKVMKVNVASSMHILLLDCNEIG